MTETLTEYQSQLSRALRNLAICILGIEGQDPEAQFGLDIAHGWREKADRLRSAIRRAERFLAVGNVAAAVVLLKQENVAR